VSDDFDEELRLAVYGALAATGTVPTDEELALRVGTDTTAVREGLRVEELPVRMLERAGGTSFLTPLRSAFFIFKGMIVLLVGQFRPKHVEAER